MAPFKWNIMLSEIREDFLEWVEQGAWKFLLAEGSEVDGEEGEESVDEEDPNIDYDDEDDPEGSESDYSDDFSDEESSDPGSSSELSEEGQDWDELEKAAEEEDRRNATRRNQYDARPSTGKRRR